MWRNYSIVFAFIFATCCFSAQTQRAKKPPRQEQTLFSGEEGSVEQPATIPESILGTLGRTQKASADGVLSDSIQASVVHLGGAGEVGLIIIGVGLRDTQSVPFWVFRKTNRGYELVLAFRGDELEVLNEKSNAHRDIAAYRFGEANGSTTLYRFDGMKYRKFRTIRSKLR